MPSEPQPTNGEHRKPAGLHPTLIFLNGKKNALESAVPTTLRSTLTWERILQAVGMALAKSEKLRGCSPHSVYSSVLEIVGKGLDLGMDGMAYLVPFKGECTAMIGSQGKIELAYRSGMIDKIVCQVVYANDTIDMDLANGTVHHPMTIAYLTQIANLDGPGRGDMLAAYARVWVKGVSEPMLEVMTIREFEQIKKAASERTNGKLSPAYKAWPSEMFRRSVLNRALKRAPKSRDLLEVLNRETALESAGGDNAERDVLETAGAIADGAVDESRRIEAPALDADEIEASLTREKELAHRETAQKAQPQADDGHPFPSGDSDDGGPP